MKNRIKYWSLISVVAGIILLLTGCFAENVDNVNIHFPDGGLAPDEKMYIRYDDGSTVLVDNEVPRVTGSTYTVATDHTKKVIGYFVEGGNTDFHYNWVPALSDYSTTSIGGDTLDINLHLEPGHLNKPTHEISYAKVCLANESTGVIILYDKYDNPINPNSESADLYVKTGNTNISFLDLNSAAADSVSTSSVTGSVYNFVSSATLALFHSSNSLQDDTVPQLQLTIYSGTSTTPIPVYAYDYVPQLDLNHDGIVDIADVVGFVKNPIDAYNDHVIKDIPFVLSKIAPHSQTLRVISDPFPSSFVSPFPTIDSMR